MIREYVDAGYRVFPLWPIMPGGACGCGNLKCEQPGKHPRISNWSQVPHWSEEQIEMMIEHQGAESHFGVVVDGFLVIDIDPRNGGNEAYWRLVEHLDGEELSMSSSYVVKTGGGGQHIYFALPDDGAGYLQHLRGFDGIDFKTSGYVVGAGSLHKSGDHYEGYGDAGSLVAPPAAILDMLRRPDQHRNYYRGESIDLSLGDIRAMLDHVDNSGEGLHYEDWIRVGMAIHHATNGSGYDLWANWSARSDKHDEAWMGKRWHSFGKSSNPVTIGTLIHYAQEGGYRPPVTLPEEGAGSTDKEPFDTAHIDLLRPPGLVGEVAQWINTRCRYPRERLAVVAALTAIGNIAGLRHTDDKDGATLNLLSLCVAGSATGKEAVLQASTMIHEAVGVHKAMVGSIKSEQEIVRNLTRNQASYYLVDEMGYLLQKIESARQKGGAAYLDGVIATIMAVYSKADGSFLVTGDLKEEVRKELGKELSQCQQKIDDNDDASGRYKRRAEEILERDLPNIETGVQSPFLSLMGMTTPVSFDGIVTAEQATNGFIGRCLLIREHETNPRRKRGWRKPKGGLPEPLKMALMRLYDGGTFDMQNNDPALRVERHGERIEVPTEDEAVDMLEDAADWLEEYAEAHKGRTGFEAIVRRSYEHLTKISTILAVGEGVRTTEHVRWAFRLVREDLENKIQLAQANTEEGTDDALRVRVLDAVGDGEKAGTIRKRVARVKQYTGDDADRMLDHLVQSGEVEAQEHVHPLSGKVYAVYQRV